MSKRHLLAACLMVCAMTGLTSPQVRADDAPATAVPLICTGLVPDDAFAALVLYPRRVLTSPALAKFDLTGLTEDMTNQTGISFADIEQAVVLMGPLKGAHRQPYDEGIIRLSKPIDRAALTAKLLKEPEEAEIDGHKYYRRARGLPKNMQSDNDSGVFFVDDRTFITFEGKRLSKILASKDAKSTLISALAANDSAADATIVFTNTDSAKEFIADSIPAKGFPGPLKPVGDLPRFAASREAQHSHQSRDFAEADAIGQG